MPAAFEISGLRVVYPSRLGPVHALEGISLQAEDGEFISVLGPSGCGKSTLMKALAGLLPPLTMEESLETSAIHSAWGQPLDSLLGERPFRSPHHTATEAALVGGGANPKPGEASLAHNGVLFLDELPEFRRPALEALRQPLEEGHITIARARVALRLPARFQLVAAMNPCVCGFRGDARRGCSCTPTQLRSYAGRVSGPLLDRIDLRVEVQALSYADIAGPGGEASSLIAERVALARARQAERRRLNCELSGARLRQFAVPDRDGTRLLAAAVDRFGLTARAYDRVLRVARTIADLEGSEAISARHLAEALQFRGAISD